MKSRLFSILAVASVLACGGLVVSCGDKTDDLVVSEDNFTDLPESRDLPFSYEDGNKEISFKAPGAWHIELQPGVDWVYFSPSSGRQGRNTVVVKVGKNMGAEGRTAGFSLVCGSLKEDFTVRQPEFGGTLPGWGEAETSIIDKATIPDFDKFFANSEHGAKILYKNAQFSFARYKSSEHFFVFWTPEFGDNPNAPSVPANMRVDIDDLLAKAEKFYDKSCISVLRKPMAW